jgi:hypothetical protein
LCDPVVELGVVGEPGAGDIDKPCQRPAGEVHRSGVRALQGLGADTDHELVADDTAGHAAVEQQREPAEHPSFIDRLVGACTQDRGAQAVGEGVRRKASIPPGSHDRNADARGTPSGGGDETCTRFSGGDRVPRFPTSQTTG